VTGLFFYLLSIYLQGRVARLSSPPQEHFLDPLGLSWTFTEGPLLRRARLATLQDHPSFLFSRARLSSGPEYGFALALQASKKGTPRAVLDLDNGCGLRRIPRRRRRWIHPLDRLTSRILFLSAVLASADLLRSRYVHSSLDLNPATAPRHTPFGPWLTGG